MLHGGRQRDADNIPKGWGQGRVRKGEEQLPDGGSQLALTFRRLRLEQVTSTLQRRTATLPL